MMISGYVWCAGVVLLLLLLICCVCRRDQEKGSLLRVFAIVDNNEEILTNELLATHATIQ